MIWVAVRVCHTRLYLIAWCVVILGMSCSAVFRELVIDAGGLGINAEAVMDMSNIYSFDRSTVVSRLVRWGKWKIGSGVALGYPNMSAFMRLTPNDTIQNIADEIGAECAQTNKAVEMLPLLHKLIIRVEYELAYKDIAVKAHSCGISKRQYYNFLTDAHDRVANNLNLCLQIVHENDINLLNVSGVRLA